MLCNANRRRGTERTGPDTGGAVQADGSLAGSEAYFEVLSRAGSVFIFKQLERTICPGPAPSGTKTGEHFISRFDSGSQPGYGWSKG